MPGRRTVTGYVVDYRIRIDRGTDGKITDWMFTCGIVPKPEKEEVKWMVGKDGIPRPVLDITSKLKQVWNLKNDLALEKVSKCHTGGTIGVSYSAIVMALIATLKEAFTSHKLVSVQGPATSSGSGVKLVLGGYIEDVSIWS